MNIKQRILGNANFGDLKGGEIFRFSGSEDNAVYLKLAEWQMTVFQEEACEYIPTIVNLTDGSFDFTCHFKPHYRVEILNYDLVEKGAE